jgi:hypothetical protein
MRTDENEFPKDFLTKMDAGELDGHFTTEVKKLSKEQLEQLARVLVDRDEEKRRG